MADEPQAKQSRRREQPAEPAEPAPQTEQSQEQSESYAAAGWKERARQRFKVSPHAVAGALHDVDPDEQLSESDVQARVDKFLGREASS